MNWTRTTDDPITRCKTFACGALRVFVADETSREYRATKQMHLSISHPYRYPRWDEIVDARYSLLPDDVTMVMYLPPRNEYVNLHENCFHLYEIKERP